ncbi:hypothetical protein QQX98_007025 [Neonectria punicea]|uniref:Uncharacterized protein n=1 Tax=Neonectria punicea TaxID=979145 RepID=A0ABR1GZA7_9HYPO
MSALIGLVIVLSVEHDKPLSTWTLPISLNTVISLLAVAIKAPLAFVVGAGLAQGKWAWFAKRQGPLSAFVTIEEAGRGPLGCLTLLWELKLRHWVSFGAAVTLGLLVLDPFIQGVISYEGDDSTATDSTASILRASTLDVGYQQFVGANTFQYEGTTFSTCNNFFPDISIISTAQIGFFNMSAMKAAEPPGMTCRTDVSSHLNKSTVVGDFRECGDAVSPTISNYTQFDIPYGRNKTLFYRRRNGEFNERQDCAQARTNLSISFRPQDTYSFQHLDTLLASFITLDAQTEYWDAKSLWEDTKMRATECAMSYCIQTYHPTMMNGKIEQRLLSTSFERAQDSWQSSLDNAKTLKAVEDQVGKSLASFSGFDSCDVVPRTDLQLKLLNGSANLPNEVQRVFNISQKSILSTMAGLDTATSTTINKVLSNSTNITASFENSARLLSYRMSEIDSSRVSGTTQQWVVYIRVRWPFLAAPIAMVLGGVIFATGVIMESQKLRLDIFKADPLKMLVCGFDDETRGYIKVNKMSENDLKQATMGLGKGEDGVELSLKPL